jgi:hypothetical protein
VNALELSKDVKARLAELQGLSEQVENGDKAARRELRLALRASSPEVVARASDLARWGQKVLIPTAAGKDPLMEEALCARLDLMRAQIAGQDASPLELLLTERIVSCWLLVETLDALVTVQLTPHLKPEQRLPMSHLRHVFKWQESANRRYLSAIRELAWVRKLQSNTPGVQYNSQINVSPEARSDDFEEGP